MKNRPSLIVNLLTSSTLFWGVPAAEGNEGIFTILADIATSCRIELSADASPSLKVGGK
jgi:hypothetical protein